MRTPSIRRPLLILGAVTALMVTAVAPAAAVPPEVENGQVGHWEVPENEVTPTVNCRYNGSPDKLDKFVAKPPLVWWNDSDSGSDTEHGKVGWRIRIQETANEDTGPWTKTYETPILKKTAYEDQPFEDAADAAPFTTRGIPWSRSGSKAYRVVYVLYWFRPNGTIRGWAKHWISYYKLTGEANGSFVGHCPNKLFS